MFILPFHYSLKGQSQDMGQALWKVKILVHIVGL